MVLKPVESFQACQLGDTQRNAPSEAIALSIDGYQVSQVSDGLWQRPLQLLVAEVYDGDRTAVRVTGDALPVAFFGASPAHHVLVWVKGDAVPYPLRAWTSLVGSEVQCMNKLDSAKPKAQRCVCMFEIALGAGR
eukprot:CAMPEP_0117698608 /NCGR_PEP_ID=MMETSP0804-20121206/29845_1 /TAXON_ID=1074897 /ORGANISM="Tetraselmis astigmatica, Strain CCMP880" /LENGTH=134 /DNA_ID=CAMNT_0005512921 /DNA_START=994 /DNA_END=1399 /DNA_ORIENTATION=+